MNTALLQFLKALVFLAMRLGRATAEDARRRSPIPPHVAPNAIGRAVRELADAGIIGKAGTTNAERGPAHGRLLRKWRIADEKLARQFLALPVPAETGQGELPGLEDAT